MSSQSANKRSLSVSLEETINANSRLLYDRIQGKNSDPDQSGSLLQGHLYPSLLQGGNQKEEIFMKSKEKEIPQEDSVLKRRVVEGASPDVAKRDDKIMNADEKEDIFKGKENLLNCFAEYKAEQEAVEMSQEFFVNSIKELLTGELGYVSQSMYADAKKNKLAEWKKYNESNLFAKLFNHPGMTILSVKDSVIKNTQKYSIRFLWRWVPHRELQFLFVLYLYSLLLLPEILFTVIPTLISICIFLTMVVYSLQIISARFDFSEYLSIVNTMGFVDDIYKYVIASNYLKKTCFLYYVKFFLCWFLFLFIFPQVEGQIPSIFVPFSFIFFLASVYFALQVREKVVYLSLAVWYFEFLTWLIGLFIGPSVILLAIGSATKITHTLLFIYMAYCYKWKGFMLLVCPHFFMSVWWKMFALSVINIEFSKLLYIILGTVIFIMVLPFLTVLFFILLALSPLAVWYFYGLNAALLFWGGLVTAAFAVFLFGLFYDKLLKLDLIRMNFNNTMWLCFLALISLCFLSYSYSQFQFNNMPALKWKEYTEFCSAKGGQQNFASVQHKCLHLVGRKIYLEGTVDNIYLESRSNSLEYVINKIPFSPLVQGLTCLLGRKESNREGCDVQKYPSLCQAGHCTLSLGEEFTYSIELSLRPRESSHKAKVLAGGKFRDDLLKLRKWDDLKLLTRIEEVGATSSKVKLLYIVSKHHSEEPGTLELVINHLWYVVYYFLL